MLAEGESVEAFDDVLLVLRIVLIQCLDQPGLDKTLLEQSLLILENFEGEELFLFVVENTENDTK